MNIQSLNRGQGEVVVSFVRTKSETEDVEVGCDSVVSAAQVKDYGMTARFV